MAFCKIFSLRAVIKSLPVVMLTNRQQLAVFYSSSKSWSKEKEVKPTTWKKEHFCTLFRSGIIIQSLFAGKRKREKSTDNKFDWYMRFSDEFAVSGRIWMLFWLQLLN